MLRVGLTGGIASGKSAVARTLAELGAVVIDADELARQVVEPGTDGLRRVVQEFGPQVLAAGGALDRGALAGIVFADAAARGRLEAIVHPLVRAQAERLEAAAARADPHAVVVQMIPLLVETGQAGPATRFDVVVVVDADPDEQVRRLTRDRGMSVEQATSRLQAQVDRAQRLAAADLVVRNDDDLATLRARSQQLWTALQARATAPDAGG